MVESVGTSCLEWLHTKAVFRFTQSRSAIPLKFIRIKRFVWTREIAGTMLPCILCAALKCVPAAHISSLKNTNSYSMYSIIIPWQELERSTSRKFGWLYKGKTCLQFRNGWARNSWKTYLPPQFTVQHQFSSLDGVLWFWFRSHKNIDLHFYILLKHLITGDIFLWVRF